MTDPHAMRRRTVLGGAAALGVGLPLLGGVGVAHAATPDGAPDAAAATRRAVSFLQRVTDAFQATGPRLAQSYQDASGLTDVGFIYDNALTAIALLAAGDVRRARAIGDGFLARPGGRRAAASGLPGGPGPAGAGRQLRVHRHRGRRHVLDRAGAGPARPGHRRTAATSTAW